MRTFDIALAVAGMATLSAPIWSEKAERPADVMVYVTGDDLLLLGTEQSEIKRAVGRTFAPVGIRISWVDGKPKNIGPPAAPVVVYVQFIRRSFQYHRPGVLADATPFAPGVKTITVICERVQAITNSHDRVPRIVAHILAHEIGHVLLATDQHDEIGLMKGTWDREEFDAMKTNSLGLTSSDLELVRERLKWLKTRAGYLANGSND